MKTAICVLAKDEDQYIEEWLEYHFKLGIDDIFVIQHDNWHYAGRHFSGLHLSSVCHNTRQEEALNECLFRIKDDFDWILFIDVDEFIVLKNGDNDIKTFLSRYDDYSGVCFNWRLYGDSRSSENHQLFCA